MYSLILVLLLPWTIRAQVQRDGPVSNVPGWSGLTYNAVRWEPLCGSLTYTRSPGDNWNGCVAAIDGYTNDTQRTFALYDRSGVLLPRAGVGLGIAVCMCFSLSVVTTDEKLDICWGFDEKGIVYNRGRSGSWRTSTKALPRCASVNLDSLQAQWSQTAFMPSNTGPGQGPNIATFTVTSSTVVTGSDGQVATQPVIIVTATPVSGSGGSQGSSSGNTLGVGLGVGIGLGMLAIAALVGLWLYLRYRGRQPHGDSGPQKGPSPSYGPPPPTYGPSPTYGPTRPPSNTRW